jgi:hypothetical protein
MVKHYFAVLPAYKNANFIAKIHKNNTIRTKLQFSMRSQGVRASVLHTMAMTRLRLL